MVSLPALVAGSLSICVLECLDLVEDLLVLAHQAEDLQLLAFDQRAGSRARAQPGGCSRPSGDQVKCLAQPARIP